MPKGIWKNRTRTPHTEEHKRKISLALMGRVFSEKTKEKHSVKMKKRYKDDPKRWLAISIANLPKNNQGLANGNWKGGLVERACGVCSKQFYVKKKVVKAGWGKFCSKQCTGIDSMLKMKKGDTDIERIFEAGLKSLEIIYKKQVPLLGITVADFVVGDKIIYCDGDYWHKKPEVIKRDKRINKKLREKGYQVYRFWGEDIKNSLQNCMASLT